MPKAHLYCDEITTPDTPATGFRGFYPKSDGWYDIDDAGTETKLGGGASLPVADTTSIVEGSADATKELRFEVDGLTTATTRVITMPDRDIDLGDVIADVSVLVYKSSNQSLTGGVWTALTWAAEKYDTDAIHDTVSNTDRLTVPSGHAGKWRGFANVSFDTGGGGATYGVRVYHYNSSSVLQDVVGEVIAPLTSGGYLNVGWEANLAVGDYIVIQAIQTNGGALNVLADNGATGTQCTRTGMRRVS